MKTNVVNPVGTLIRTSLPKGKRWLRVKDIPLSKNVIYQLINSEAVESVLIRQPGGKKGVRLIDGDSFDSYYLESLKGQKLTRWCPRGRPKSTPRVEVAQ